MRPGDGSAVVLGARARRRRLLLSDGLALAPATILYTCLLVGPAFVALFLSFFSWNGVGALNWVGLGGWSRFFGDNNVWYAMWLTVQVTVISWVLQTLSALTIGIATARPSRLHSILAAVYVLPLLVSTTAVGLLWGAFLSPTLGGLAYLGQDLHLHFLSTTDWLGSPAIVLYVITFIVAWELTPFYTLLYRIARQQVPVSLYEAAQLDGASPLQQLVHVTLPQLRNTVATTSILMVITGVTNFDLFFILTDGGPGRSSTVLPLYMYNLGFFSNEYGYASTVAVFLVVLGLLLGGVIMWLTRFSTASRQTAGG
jgi:raffinose/stachyose/melibiose transport system permease protein